MTPITTVILGMLLAGLNVTPQDVISMTSQAEYVPCLGNAKHFTTDGKSPCHDCWHFSNDLKAGLNVIRVESEVVLVTKPGKRHYIVAANLDDSWKFIEPQTGEEANMTEWKLVGVESPDYATRKKVMRQKR